MTDFPPYLHNCWMGFEQTKNVLEMLCRNEKYTNVEINIECDPEKIDEYILNKVQEGELLVSLTIPRITCMPELFEDIRNALNGELVSVRNKEVEVNK